MCKIDGCDRAPIAKALCAKHYMRLHRNGDANLVRKPGPKRSKSALRERSAQVRFDQALRLLRSVVGEEEAAQAIKAATRPNGSVRVSKLLGIAAARYAGEVER
jgi:hypothetical protein